MPDKIKEVKVSWQKLKTVEEAEAEALALIEKVLGKAEPAEAVSK